MKQNVEKEIRDIVSELLGVRDISRNKRLVGQDGVLDSMTAVELVSIIEERFGVCFEDDMLLENLNTVDSLISYVEASLA